MVKRRNVLLILTDDQRFDTIHALGNDEIITPNLDKLCRRGTAFTGAHIPGGTCGAICMPSRAMLNTGRSLFHLRGEGQTIPKEHTLMGETFKENGYYCFGTGKWHNSPQAFTRSFTDGENAFFGGMWDHWNVPVCHYDETGQYDNEISFVMDFMHQNAPVQIHCDAFHPGKHSTELVTDTVIRAIEERPPEKPFFLYAAYLAPHDPRTMPKRFEEMYDPVKISLPDNFAKEPFDFGVLGIRDEVLAAFPRDEGEIRKHIAQYYAMITHLDYELGRIIRALEDAGELDSTIIVLAGDNGLAVGQHGLMGKQNHFEHSIRVPLLFAGPGIPEGRKIDKYVYLMDIYPTLCELMGFPVPPSVEGLSFARMLEDDAYVTRETLYFAYTHLIRSVKDGRYKLIRYRNYAERTQLYDLREDPWETRDLSGLPAYAATVKRLEEQLLILRREWEDVPNEHTDRYWSGIES